MLQITYPYLPNGRDIKYVSQDNFFMREAKKVCLENSTDGNHPTGSVIVKDGTIIGKAANKSFLKNKNLIKIHKDYLCIRKLLKIKTGTKYWLCPGCAQFKHHSEQMALRDAVKKGFDTNGADLYLWGHWWCCKPCWDKIIEAGIKNVFLLEDSQILFK